MSLCRSLFLIVALAFSLEATADVGPPPLDKLDGMKRHFYAYQSRFSDFLFSAQLLGVKPENGSQVKLRFRIKQVYKGAMGDSDELEMIISDEWNDIVTEGNAYLVAARGRLSEPYSLNLISQIAIDLYAPMYLDDYINYLRSIEGDESVEARLLEGKSREARRREWMERVKNMNVVTLKVLAHELRVEKEMEKKAEMIEGAPDTAENHTFILPLLNPEDRELLLETLDRARKAGIDVDSRTVRVY